MSIRLVRSHLLHRMNVPSRISRVSNALSIGLPDRSGSTTIPVCPASESQLERLRLLTMNNQTKGTHIQFVGVYGRTARTGFATAGASTSESRLDWITPDTRDEPAARPW